MTAPNEVRARLLEIRGERTQAKAAADYSIPLRTWEDWEAGRRRPPEYVLRMMEELKKREA